MTELRRLGRTLNHRASDVQPYFDRPGTSNGARLAAHNDGGCGRPGTRMELATTIETVLDASGRLDVDART